MNNAIHARVLERGITRLCHFTSVRNLLHIARDGCGLVASSRLQQDERLAFNPNDLKRLDGHPEHICCSIQYPNLHFFKKVRDADPIFKEWVILGLDPMLLCQDDTLFCPRNAAAGLGKFIVGGEAGFDSMFSSSVSGAGGNIFVRKSHRLASCPTDEQAEVLVPSSVPFSQILCAIVSSEDQAATNIERLRLQGTSSPSFVVAPDLFEQAKLTYALANGIPPSELDYVPESP